MANGRRRRSDSKGPGETCDICGNEFAVNYLRAHKARKHGIPLRETSIAPKTVARVRNERKRVTRRRPQQEAQSSVALEVVRYSSLRQYDGNEVMLLTDGDGSLWLAEKLR